MQSTEHDYRNLPPEYIQLAIEWQQASPERRAAIEQEQQAMLQPKKPRQPVKPFTPEWVKGIIASDNYSPDDYRRFQQQLRERRKTGLLQMMQRLLKAKFERAKV